MAHSALVPAAGDPASLRYARVRWNTPLVEDHADLLLRRLEAPAGGSVLDLGCGWGELLLTAVAASGAARGVGVDADAGILDRGRRAAASSAPTCSGCPSWWSRSGVPAWRVLHFSTADQREWGDFESTWRAGRQEWLLAQPDDPRVAGVRDELDARLREYVTVYRGLLDFGYFVLGR